MIDSRRKKNVEKNYPTKHQHKESIARLEAFLRAQKRVPDRFILDMHVWSKIPTNDPHRASNLH